MAKGDIVLITFPFTDLSGSKLRPAVVLADTNLDRTVCFITTQISWQETTDVLLTPNATNGLRKQSLIRTSKIATLDRTLAKGLLGKLSPQELNNLDAKLRVLLQLPWRKTHAGNSGFVSAGATNKTSAFCSWSSTVRTDWTRMSIWKSSVH